MNSHVKHFITAHSLQQLTLAAHHRRRSAIRPSTARNHHSAQKLFLQFAMMHNMSPDNITCNELSAYAEWLAQGGLSSQTVRNHFGAIKAMFVWVDNTRVINILDSMRWRLTIQGIVNTVRPPCNLLNAMTPDHLSAMVDAAASSTIVDSAGNNNKFVPLMVALTFGFFGYLRVSNLAPNTAANFDITRHTTVGDLQQHKQGLLLNIKWSKSRQTDRKPVIIPLPCLGKSLLCPVRAWRIYNTMLRYAGITTTATSPLLLTLHEPTGRPLTIPMPRSMFKQVASLAHLEDEHYTPHSLRRGGATFSYQSGVPLENIKCHGMWKSSAVDRYLSTIPLFEAPVASMFVQRLTNFQ